MRSFWKEWLGLFFSLLLAFAGSLVVLDRRKPQDTLMGWTCILFFTLAALAFAHTLWTRRQARAYMDVGPVTLVPGARFIMKRGRMLALGTVVALLGTLVVLSARMESNWIVVASGAIFLAGGLSLLILSATGILGSHYLLFEPGGLKVGDRGGSLLIAWDNLAQIQVSEYKGNPAVYFWFKDPEALARTVEGPSKRWGQEKVRKQLKRSRDWLDCDWMILTWHYGLNPVLLAKAVLTYVKDPEVREGLRKHLELEGPDP